MIMQEKDRKILLTEKAISDVCDVLVADFNSIPLVEADRHGYPAGAANGVKIIAKIYNRYCPDPFAEELGQERLEPIGMRYAFEVSILQERISYMVKTYGFGLIRDNVDFIYDLQHPMRTSARGRNLCYLQDFSIDDPRSMTYGRYLIQRAFNKMGMSWVIIPERPPKV